MASFFLSAHCLAGRRAAALPPKGAVEACRSVTMSFVVVLLYAWQAAPTHAWVLDARVRTRWRCAPFPSVRQSPWLTAQALFLDG